MSLMKDLSNFKWTLKRIKSRGKTSNSFIIRNFSRLFNKLFTFGKFESPKRLNETCFVSLKLTTEISLNSKRAIFP